MSVELSVAYPNVAVVEFEDTVCEIRKHVAKLVNLSVCVE